VLLAVLAAMTRPTREGQRAAELGRAGKSQHGGENKVSGRRENHRETLARAVPFALPMGRSSPSRATAVNAKRSI